MQGSVQISACSRLKQKPTPQGGGERRRGRGRASGEEGKEECWWVKILFPLLFARFELKFVGVSISGERYVASDIARERERNIY